MTELEGKVIRILSDTELVINLGANDGVDYNSKFEIYEPGEEIIDPETHKSLGVLDYVKAHVEILEVHKAFSLVHHETTTTETVSRGALSAFAQTSKEVQRTRVHRLPVNSDAIKPRNIKNEQIQVGDPVRKV